MQNWTIVWYDDQQLLRSRVLESGTISLEVCSFDQGITEHIVLSREMTAALKGYLSTQKPWERFIDPPPA